ncbi:MAG: ATP-binding protein [Deltaproteobacteria bacterium]|nr:ATP-binding protein [Deltaproteobacteria bacterium]
MFDEYLSHNLFSKGVERFLQGDPNLLSLQGIPFIHPMDWWQPLDWKIPGIYILTGGRQIGKTTSTKLLFKHLLTNRLFDPSELFYLPCDQIDSHQQLGRIVRQILEELTKSSGKFLLVIDEVTYVKEWDKAIKLLADEGWFRKGLCILTGSDSVILKEAMSRFPGRRGEANRTDFHLRPLSFYETVLLTDPKMLQLEKIPVVEILARFQRFCRSGGYLKAINEIHVKGEISDATYRTFEQWIQGDFEKRGKSSHMLLGILKNIVETTSSQITYSSLTQRMGEISKETFLDYCHLLERMDVLFNLQAFDQNKKIGFPKKARKLHFWDPFIMDTIARWLHRERMIQEPIFPEPSKVESIVAAHCMAKFPTYYAKGKGEVDVIAVHADGIHAMEIKWTKQLRPFDLQELKKFQHPLILSKEHEGTMNEIPVQALPVFLLQLGRDLI